MLNDLEKKTKVKAIFKGCKTVKSIMGTTKAANVLHIIMHTPESRTRERKNRIRDRLRTGLVKL